MIDKELLTPSEGLKDGRYGLARLLLDVLRQCELLEKRADIVRRGSPYFWRRIWNNVKSKKPPISTVVRKTLLSTDENMERSEAKRTSGSQQGRHFLAFGGWTSSFPRLIYTVMPFASGQRESQYCSTACQKWQSSIY